MRGDRDHELIGFYFRLVTAHLHKKFQPSMMPEGLSIPYRINHFFGRDTGGAPPIKVVSKVRKFWTLHLSISVARQVGLITFFITCLATDCIAAALFTSRKQATSKTYGCNMFLGRRPASEYVADLEQHFKDFNRQHYIEYLILVAK